MGMITRSLLACAALAACYAPDTRDCTVACEAETDCAGDQVCGAEGLCVAPDRAEACAAGARLAMRILIEGAGSVVAEGVGECRTTATARAECTWQVAAGATLRLVATPQASSQFDRWTSSPCSGQGAACMLAPTAPITVGARFKNGSGGNDD